METKSFSFKTEDVQDEGIVVGYASTEKRDVDGDVVEAGAFAKTITERSTFPLLFMHDVKQPIGLVKELEYDGKGIRFTAEIDLDIEEGKRVFSGVRKGYIDRTSIGFKTIKSDYDKSNKTRYIKELKLYELSMVTKNFSANDAALVTGYKSLSDFVETVQTLKADELTQEQLEASILHLQALLQAKAVEPSSDTQPLQPSDDTVNEVLMLMKRLRESL